MKAVIKPNTKTYKLRSLQWTVDLDNPHEMWDMTTNPPTMKAHPSMKKAKIAPVNNNVIVRRIKKPATLEKQGGLYIPMGTTMETTEEVEIVSISADIKPLSGGALVAKAGDRALIHNGVQGTPVTVGGEDLFVVGYVSLIAILS